MYILKANLQLIKKYSGQETDLYPRKTQLTKFELSRRNVSNSINIVKTLRDITTKIYYVVFTYLDMFFVQNLTVVLSAVACSSLVTAYCYADLELCSVVVFTIKHFKTKRVVFYQNSNLKARLPT